MTVSSSTSRASYSGNGTLTTFAYSFKVFDQDDLTVILRASNGTETVQTITTDYTVTGVGSVSGGNVVFGTAPASGVTVVILREMDLEQGLDLVPNDPFPAESLEDSLDKLTFMVQQHDEQLGRAIKASRTNVLSGSEFVISAADRANKVFSFDGSGDLAVTQELGTFQGDWATATVYQVRDIVKDTSTNNIFIVNTEHTSSGAQPLTTNANSAKYDLIVDAASATTSATNAAASETAAQTAQTASETAQAAAEAAQAAAETAETNAETAETNAETAQAAAEAAQSAAETVYDTFDDRYLGAKSTSGGDPTVDNDGNALIDGALFFDTTNNVTKVYNLGTTSWLRTTPTTSDQTNINTVSGIQANVTTVAGISGNVTTVAGVSANVTTVAGSIASVNTNATNIASINTNASNISDIQNASANAASALASKNAAETAETNAETAQTAAETAQTAAETAETNAATSETNAANSAASASTDAGTATTKAGEAAASATASATSASASEAAKDAALAALDNFDDRYLGSKASDPTLDNDGNALISGALYFNTTDDVMKVYDGSSWLAAYASLSGALLVANNLSDLASASAGRTNLGLGTAATSAATDFVAVTGDTMTGNLDVGGTVTADNGSSTVALNGNSLVFDRNSANYIRTSDASGYLRLQTGFGDTAFLSANGDISFYDSTGTTPKFFWDASAERLSLGTTSASTELHVKGSGDYAALTLEATTSGGASYVNLGDSADIDVGQLAYFNSDNSMRFTTNASEAMRIDSSGNVIATSGSLNLVGTNTQMFASANGQDIQFKFAGVKKAQINNSGLISSSDGNATVPGFRFVDDPNTGMFRATTDTLAFSTAGSEAMRLDASGNLLVGQSSSTQPGVGNTTNGFAIRNDGLFFSSAYQGRTGTFGRNGNDGPILGFYKDGSTVGSITSHGGSDLGIGSGDTGLRFQPSADAIFGYNNISDSGRNGQIDLGKSDNRFKDGHFSGTVNAANFNTTSDATLKTNVETLTGSLDAVKSLRGVSFDWIENGNSEVGVIAQEVEAVLPDVVSTNDQGIKSVKYGNMVALLIEAMKEQQAQIDELKAKLGE